MAGKKHMTGGQSGEAKRGERAGNYKSWGEKNWGHSLGQGVLTGVILQKIFCLINCYNICLPFPVMHYHTPDMNEHGILSHNCNPQIIATVTEITTHLVSVCSGTRERTLE